MPIDLDSYAEFIGQIELDTIWLASAKVDNRVGPGTFESVSIQIQDSARWEPTEMGFRSFSQYSVRFSGKANKPLAKIEATFVVDYASIAPMTADVFTIFQEANLPLNTWPHLREYLSTTLARMNWPPFTLPALKRGARSSVPGEVPSDESGT